MSYSSNSTSSIIEKTKFSSPYLLKEFYKCGFSCVPFLKSTK
uniref:Uncharacterized protein n=1 Tax=Siphoviridae sp. ctLqe90 TaxID=2825456 RepID=A0A8S5Q1U9_9CAUD|nr:MAG TPA: hypothetical protein [Siphoviridae sp. ctLqe90]DAG35988.1 MAG TPA: hypothetical protein [Caudoviricetes sp.]